MGIESKLGEASKISRPLMLHVATEDQFVPKEAQAQVADGLKGNAQITLFRYPGLGHDSIITKARRYRSAFETDSMHR